MNHLRLHCFVILTMVLSPVILSASPSGETSEQMEYPNACINCHGDSPAYPMRGAALEYETSGHRNGGNSHYANGNGCQQCHTNEGFIEYVETGKVEGYVAIPSQPGCFTCHTPHTTGDFSLRTTDPVTLANGTVFDIGAGNLCANCHRARSDAQVEVKPIIAKSVSVRLGPHHGPQADVLMGTNAFEFPGKEYSSSAHREIIKDGCAICHMSQPQGRYSLSPEVGGHSFSIIGEVHEAEKVNVSSCVNCHDGVAQVRGTDLFNIMAEKDFDLDGSLEPIQAEVEGLLDEFLNDQGTGVLQNLDPPFFNAEGAWIPTTVEDERPVTEIAALYNYRMLLEDRSKGVHNTIYTIQILYDSLKGLDPDFDDSLRPE